MRPHNLLAEKRIMHARQHGLLGPGGGIGGSRRFILSSSSCSRPGGRRQALLIIAFAGVLLVLLHVRPLYFGYGGSAFLVPSNHEQRPAGGGGHGDGHKAMIYGESLGVLGGFAANTAAATGPAGALGATPTTGPGENEEQKVLPADETKTKQETEGKTLVPLEAHIMSKCPDARDCLEMMVVPAMTRVKDMVDFRLSFIGKYVIMIPASSWWPKPSCCPRAATNELSPRQTRRQRRRRVQARAQGVSRKHSRALCTGSLSGPQNLPRFHHVPHQGLQLYPATRAC